MLDKKIVRHSKSPWSCPAFYVQKSVELERGVPRLVINYKPLNKVLEWIRYPIPNKQDLINRLSDSVIFSKFDLKSEGEAAHIKQISAIYEKQSIYIYRLYIYIYNKIVIKAVEPAN